ncbi:hypothetical protein ACVIJU_002845 [Aeribacillus sp. SP014]
MGNRFFVSVPGLTKNVHINRRIGFAANSPYVEVLRKNFFPYMMNEAHFIF